jgi:hypothetical protein
MKKHEYRLLRVVVAWLSSPAMLYECVEPGAACILSGYKGIEVNKFYNNTRKGCVILKKHIKINRTPFSLLFLQ